MTVNEKAHARLIKQSHQEGECLLFKGKATKDGINKFSYHGKDVCPSRLMYKLLRDVFLPDDKKVYHKCGRTNCVAPGHLTIDPNHGEKLTKPERVQIRRSMGNATIEERAKVFGTTPEKIREIDNAGQDAPDVPEEVASAPEVTPQ